MQLCFHTWVKVHFEKEKVIFEYTKPAKTHDIWLESSCLLSFIIIIIISTLYFFTFSCILISPFEVLALNIFSWNGKTLNYFQFKPIVGRNICGSSILMYSFIPKITGNSTCKSRMCSLRARKRNWSRQLLEAAQHPTHITRARPNHPPNNLTI